MKTIYSNGGVTLYVNEDLLENNKTGFFTTALNTVLDGLNFATLGLVNLVRETFGEETTNHLKNIQNARLKEKTNAMQLVKKDYLNMHKETYLSNANAEDVTQLTNVYMNKAGSEIHPQMVEFLNSYPVLHKKLAPFYYKPGKTEYTSAEIDHPAQLEKVMNASNKVRSVMQDNAKLDDKIASKSSPISFLSDYTPINLVKGLFTTG